MLERRPVNASLKLHVTARPANYSRAREWEKFLSLSPWALDVYKRGSRYAGVLHNVQANFHCNTRFCYANRNACRQGFLARCSASEFFWTTRRKSRPMLAVDRPRLNQRRSFQVIHFNLFFRDSIRRNKYCWLDLDVFWILFFYSKERE